MVVVVVAVAVEVVAAVAVPHLVCLWWSEWTVMGGVLHCAPMCQQSTCNSKQHIQGYEARASKCVCLKKQNQVLQFAFT